MNDPQRRPPPNVPTLRPSRLERSQPEAALEQVSGLELQELEGLIDEAEQQIEAVQAFEKTEAGPPVELGRPPEEPPRQLPTIGQFGPYDIVGRLALGGMAEILLAREESEGAGARYLVVKRILAEFERDQSFVEMFLDEARVMMRLSHPNVCHVYKFGRQDGTHFIAMEWVHGASLGKLIRRARKTGGLPVAVACKIVASIAEALDHAHAATNDDGRPLNIVHRDVTPDNLMISYDGAVKLLDFGIAKADARAHKTQAGVVKGKFAYMAPEQCRAKELDHRVDIFALGVCLYEALTGRPLYRRETEFETMEAIVRGPIPKLSDKMSDAPPELELIIAKCLAKKADDRFASAGELQEAIDRFTASRGEVVTARRLKELMGKLFKEELKRGPTVDTTPFGSSYHLQTSDARAVPFTEEAAAAMVEPPKPVIEMEPTVTPDYQGSGGLDLDLPPVRPAAAHNPWSAVAPAKRAAQTTPEARARALRAAQPEESGGALKWVILVAAAVAVIGAGAFVVMRHVLPGEEDGTEARTARVLTGVLVVNSEPAGAALFVDGQETGTTPVTVRDLATGAHDVRLVLEGHQTHEGRIEIRAQQTRTVAQTLAPLVPQGPVEMGRLTLTSRPRARVFLRDRDLGSTPLSNIEVPAGVLPLELETAGGERHRRGVVVRANDSTSTHIDLTSPP